MCLFGCTCTIPTRLWNQTHDVHLHAHRHTEAVWSVAFNPAEPTQLASGSEDGQVLVHNVAPFIG